MTFDAQPSDAIAAVTHPDPYPYYARLREGPPLVFDPALRLWIATRADVVREVLACRSLRVRPASEPVPRAIAGTPAGELFGQLVRMNDGALHAVHRPPLQRALGALDLRVARSQALHATGLFRNEALNDACFAMPVAAVASLLGFDDAQLPHLVRWTRAFVACLSPLSSPAQLKDASNAALALLQEFEPLLGAPRAGSLVESVSDAASGTPHVERPVLLANLIGFLSQTCDATAGLMGNAIVALQREPGLHARWIAQQASTADIVAEVARHDPSVHNTRRFADEATTIANTRLAAGDAVLVVLAAAQRDPALNPQPDRFDLARTERRMLGFGHGAHACPGQSLACTIAAAGLDAMQQTLLRHAEQLPTQWRYRPSVNGRIPEFTPP